MKIGDKVRFLNDVGGGVITGFQDKGIVLVSDEDGFEVPTLAKDVVVIETDDLNLVKKKPLPKPAAPQKKEAEQEDEEPDPADKPITFRPKAEERRGGDKLCLYLAFVPVDVKKVTDTAFEAYLINDCNYYLHYTLLTQDGNACQLRHEGELAPNTKTFLEELQRSQLDEWRRVSVQATAYKRDKAFLPKPTLNIGLRIDASRFFKLHSFQPSTFFNEPALLYEIVVNDCAPRQLMVNAEELRESLQVQPRAEEVQPARIHEKEKGAASKHDPRAVIEVDLHAGELLDTMVGLQPKDILDYQLKVFRDTMNAHLRERGRRIVFIHGKGEGVLRNALLAELKSHYPHCRPQDASFREYGFGATLVTI